MAVNSIVPPPVTPTTGEQLECSPACYSDHGGTVGDIQESNIVLQVMAYDLGIVSPVYVSYVDWFNGQLSFM